MRSILANSSLASLVAGLAGIIGAQGHAVDAGQLLGKIFAISRSIRSDVLVRLAAIQLSLREHLVLPTLEGPQGCVDAEPLEGSLRRKAPEPPQIAGLWSRGSKSLSRTERLRASLCA